MNKKKILVSGGAGYIGSHVNMLLPSKGFDTVVFDNLSRGDIQSVKYSIFFKGDLGDTQALHKLFKEHSFDAVMHFAALTDVGESTRDPLRYFRENISYTINLLQVMESYSVPYFVFSSSAAVYGTPNATSIDENTPCNPINPYGMSKLLVEQILASTSSNTNLRYVALRYFNAAGNDPSHSLINRRTHESNLIPKILKNIQQGKCCATIFGTDYPTPDGTCIRDYIHVQDLAEAHILALNHLLEGGSSEIFNLGNSHGFSVKEVLKAIEKATQTTLNITYGSRRKGDPAILIANSTKAQNLLGWKPQYTQLDTMVQNAWQGMNIS